MRARPSRLSPSWSIRQWVPARLRRAKVLAAALAGVVVLTSLGQPPAFAAPEEPPSWDAPKEKSVPGKEMATNPDSADPAEVAVRGPGKVTWPAAATDEVALSEAAESAGRSAGARVRVAESPVSVGAPTRRDPALRDDVRDPARVRVQVMDRKATARAGIDGLLLRVQRTDTGRSSDQVSLQVDYRGFAGAFGGDWAARLRIVALPGCALTTPDRTECQGRPLPTRNDTTAATLTADVDAKLAAPSTFAVRANASGSSGSYTATPLSPSATWSHGGSSGDFNWSYPLRVPPGVNGPTPQIALSYSSGSVDGRTVSTNNQPSWIGEGFEFSPGLVERKYKPCALDTASQDGQAPNNASRPTGDQCWVSDNATISLNGAGSELVPVDAGGTTWRMKKDDGTRVQRLFDTGRANGDQDGEYWVATTPDGTRYHFGYHRLPGYTGAAGQQTTGSTWTVPVYGNHPGDKGYTAGNFSASERAQGWRWNLDYVVDVHGNTMSYFYGTETNRYARNGDVNDAASYIRGGYLRRIDYGQRSNQVYSTAPVGQVEFEAADRCSAGSTCDFDHPGSWPDTPVDQHCGAAPCQGDFSPTFWTQKRLSKITTRVWDGESAHRTVDSWTLNHLYADPGDATRAGLWLDTISHTGHVAPAGQEITLPNVKFFGEPFNNRVDSAVSDHVAAHNWWRITAIHAENGGRIAVNYETPNCSAPGGLPANPQTNTKRCQPVRWTPHPSLGERLDWFHKYVVKSITQSDELTGIAPVQTHYQYLGDAAWHFDDIDGITPVQDKTWGQWRGYGQVKTRTGSPTDGQLVTETRYFRGMDGDRTGTANVYKDVWVTDSRGAGYEWEDHERLAGSVRENISWLTDGTAMLSRTIYDPWISAPTATSTKPWGTTRATLVDTLRTHTRVAVEGGWRDSLTEKTITANGTVTAISARPHIGEPKFDTCTRNEYVSNTTAHLINLPKRVETVAKNCAVTPNRPADIISDVRSYYDGLATHGATPTKGQVTRVDEFAGWNTSGNTPTYQTASSAVYDDVHGRMTSSTDIQGGVTTTGYTPASGGPVTKVTTTNHLQHKTETIIEPAFGAPNATVDANDLRTDMELDALGRLSRVWAPGKDKATDQADAEFTYLIDNAGPDVIRTSRLQPGVGYWTKYDLYDGLGRLRQTQIPSPTGGRSIADMIYDSRGLLVKRNGPYHNAAGPAFQILTPTDDAIPTQVRTLYDTAGRPTNEIKMANGGEQWRTVTTYTGINRVDVDPPTGGTPTTTISDARGAVTQLRQYTGSAPSGSYDATTYTYTGKGQLASVTDAADNGGNVWSYTYDELGRLVQSDDPDRATTTNTYTNTHQLATTTDARGEKLAYAYDILGRTTALHDDSLTGAKRAEWVFDTLHKGQPTSSTRFVAGNAYVNRVVDYDDETGRPTGTETVIPAVEGALAGTYRFDVTYREDGSVNTTTMPAGGALPAETLTYGYTTHGLPATLTGTTSAGSRAYVNTTSYTAFGEPTVIGYTEGTKWVRQDLTYQPSTRRLEQVRTRTQTTGSTTYVGDRSYTYDHAGNITKVSDAPTGATADHQCYEYDYLRRLAQAWTPANGNCAPASRTVAGLGGPAKYWHSWEHDETGNRVSETIHAAAGNTTSTYTYPAAGGVQPHTLTQVDTTGPVGSKTVTYDYDDTGNTTTRPGSNGAQTLTWDAEGHLEKVQEGAEETRYVYDADGNRLIRRDLSGTTAYLPGMELHTTPITAVTATRYYSHNGQTVAVRTDDNVLTWVLADHHGTNTLAVNATTQAIQRRYSTPYGTDRGTAPAIWPDDKGFVGGTKDDTGLTHLGAREYDPTLGRFISVDPIIDHYEPQQMHGYSYAANSPITNTDPTGLRHLCGHTGDMDCNTNGVPDDREGPSTPEKEIEETIDDAQADKDRAEATKKTSMLDIIKEQGLAFLLDFFGITDIVNCFTKGDIGACVGVLMNAIPVGKILKAGKSIFMGVKRAFTAYQGWQRAIRLADATIARADEAIAAAMRKADELRAAMAKKTSGGPGKCEDNSFVPGTRVLMADGTTKPIEDVQVGDEVLATDPETGETAARPVTAQITGTGDKTLVNVILDTDGDRGDETAMITATDKHPFWVDKPGTWVDAVDLTAGDLVRAPDGSRHRVIDILAYNATATVHNLTVDDLHTYYVFAGRQAVLTHNTNASCPVHGGITGVPNRDIRGEQDCTCGKTERENHTEANQTTEQTEGIKQRRTQSEVPVRSLDKALDVAKDDPLLGVVVGIMAGAFAIYRKWRGNLP